MYILEEKEKRVCPQCYCTEVEAKGQTEDGSLHYVCPDCGWSCEGASTEADDLKSPTFYEVTKDKVSDKSWLAALIFALIGLFGIGGLARFYVGKKATGVIWIFTGGLFMVGAFYDIIMLLLNRFTDKEGKPLVRSVSVVNLD